jgi:tryptophan-rich hypothetical protein
MLSNTLKSVSVNVPDSVGDPFKASTSEGVDNHDHANTSVMLSEHTKAKVKASAGVALSNRVSPKKLLLSKWTAVHPERKEKHFLVTKVFEPEIEGQAIVAIELEAAMTGRKFCMPWRDLKNREHWRQGWL